MKHRTAAATLLAIGLVIGVAGAAEAAPAADDKIKTKLTGEAEVPGPGDPNGKGKFKAELGEDTLCYTLRAKRIADPTAAHIHVGDAETAGPVAVTLMVPTRGGVSECLTAVPDGEDTGVTLSESELAALKEAPEGFYVNVHNADFPAGAIRGQLK